MIAQNKTLLTMSHKEISRLEVMEMIASKRIRQLPAAELLGISLRQIKRLYGRYKRYGAAGLISRKRGKPSNHQLAEALKEQAIDLTKANYADFGPTLAQEKLLERDGVKIGLSTLRKLMIEENLWIPRKQRLKRAYQPRYRRDCYGELIQIDGSDHDWFEGRSPKCTLLVYIDDATSKLMMAQFFNGESTFGYFKATEKYLLEHGKPISFYSDKYCVFRVNSKNAKGGDGVTQFGRALSDLNMDIIYANTCQAKGRVERANKTLQDRLVKEMRLRGISDIDSANRYLPEFTESYNRRFAKEPKDTKNMHRSLQTQELANLSKIFSWKEDRTVTKNLTIQYDKVLYLIEDRVETRDLAGKRVTVYDDYHGTIKIVYKGQELRYRPFDKIKQRVNPDAIVENKRLGNVLKYIQERQALYDEQKRSLSSPSRSHLNTRTAH